VAAAAAAAEENEEEEEEEEGVEAPVEGVGELSRKEKQEVSWQSWS